MKNKVKSVLELGRYKIGDTAWWVVFRPTKDVDLLSAEDDWMEEYHAKAQVERGPLKKLWDKNVRLPKLHHADFKLVINLITQKPVVEEFIITDIYRSLNTGEFLYSNSDKEWMPEKFLLDSKSAAFREKSRIIKLIKQWT